MKRRVDFLIAGNQKCGTTSLASRLRQHPNTQMSTPKELRWFTRTDLDQSESGYRAYHEYGWGHSALDDASTYGEATPRYVLHDPSGRARALERIAAYNPEIKLIVLFREPGERAFSQWNMMRRNGRNPPPFEEVVSSALDGDRPSLNKNIMRRGEYGRIAFNVLSSFPAENCCFIRTSDLDVQMDRICSFLDLPHFSFDKSRRAVGAYEPLSEDLRMLLRRYYRREVELLGRLTGLFVDDWLDDCD